MYVANISLLPENVIVFEMDDISFKLLPGIESQESIKTFSLDKQENVISTLNIKLFGVIDLKNINVTTLEDVEVVPVGKVVGLKLYTNGVLVVGMSEVENNQNNLVKPYEGSNIKEGDMIFEIDGCAIEDISNLKDVVNKTQGRNVEIKLLRKGKTVVVSNITPVQVSENEYKLGLWVKDAATGVGTMTFYDPETQRFALLGHGITDSDTNSLIYIDSGELVTSKLVSIKKGEETYEVKLTLKANGQLSFPTESVTIK
jgi:stage IV sporulation protein B